MVALDVYQILSAEISGELERPKLGTLSVPGPAYTQCRVG